MDLEITGMTVELIGSLMIAYTAIRVHHRVWKEHKIDDVVFQEMRLERNIGIVGMVLLVLGYAIALWAKF